MGLSSVASAATVQQDEFLRYEAQLQVELVDAYRSIAARIDQEIGRLAGKIAAAQAMGEQVTESWLFQARRLQTLEDQVRGELEQYGVYVEARVGAMQHMAIMLGADYAHELMQTGLGGLGVGGKSIHTAFEGLPARAVEAFVGKTQHDGELLSKALSRYPVEAAAAIRKQLVVGIALAHSPKKIARELSKVVGGASDDYMTLATTEILNAHRAGALATYQANSDVVVGWEWLLGRGDACSYCQSKVGPVYSLQTPFDSHPRCKCSVVPSLKGA